MIKKEEYKKRGGIEEDNESVKNKEECKKEGLRYYYGRDGVTKDHQKALELLLPFVKEGDGEILRCLGNIYYTGEVKLFNKIMKKP